MKNLEDLEKKINSELTTKINNTEIKHNQIYIEIDKDDIIDVILFLKTNSLAGVNEGGINFQKLLSSIFSCINSRSNALAIPSTWLIMPCIPSVNNIPFNLVINHYIAFI